MLEKRVLTILELNWNKRLGHEKTKLNICHHMLTSSTQLLNRSFHVVERTRTSTKCQKMKNARAKRAKILFFIVKYANLWDFCCRRRRGCLSSLKMTPIQRRLILFMQLVLDNITLRIPVGTIGSLSSHNSYGAQIRLKSKHLRNGDYFAIITSLLALYNVDK